MTIRKHVGNKPATATEPTSSLSSGSPLQLTAESNDSTKVSEDVVTWQIDHGAYPLIHGGGDIPTTSRDEIPLPLRPGGQALTGATIQDSSNPPTSLCIDPAEVTPRSSFESQLSQSSDAIRAPSEIKKEGLAPFPLASNNPFLSCVNNTISPPAEPLGEESSTSIWADGNDVRPRSPSKEGIKSSQTFNQPGFRELPNEHSSPRTIPEPIYTSHILKPDTFGNAWNDSSTPPIQYDHLQPSVSSDDPFREADRHLQDEKDLPPLPPRNLSDAGPSLPPRKFTQDQALPNSQSTPSKIDNIRSNVGVDSRAEAQPHISDKNRNETYQIRLVNWYDASSRMNPRRSPIMVQNANGPCPLLALVNALVLSTPPHLETPLLDTLERREQVSLSLLLDAVIDELMSGRRGDAAQNLPDVGDLYAFLVNLHTGMNVNPSFVPDEPGSINLMDAPIVEGYTSQTSMGKAGGFESTREMKLYSTFAIPLIHGWIPASTHPACTALKRSAKTYEDAQNLMFVEEELEGKLSGQGLNQDDQLLLQDIATVKYFLSSSATQLTSYGLDQITKSLQPGSIAILFRNDHFSTLYRHPRSGDLFTLVTDMGFAGHDEVVWESLVDVSGEGSEFFAGDFRPVGNNYSQADSIVADRADGWTTVRRCNHGKDAQSNSTGPRSFNGQKSGPSDAVLDLSSLDLDDSANSRKSPKAEQEDHDLALALQLQEEEEERERQETAARRREDELSQTYLGSHAGPRGQGAKRGPEIRPSVPPRNSGRGRGGVSREGMRSNGRHGTSSTENRIVVQPEDKDEAPPRTDDQAARGPAYDPPPNHPAHANAQSSSPSNSTPTGHRPQRVSSAYTQNSAALADSPAISNSVSPPLGGSPATSGSRFGRSTSARNTSLARGGASGLEGAPGLYRRNGREVADEVERGRDCNVM